MDNKKCVRFKDNDTEDDTVFRDLHLVSLGFFGVKSKGLGEIRGSLGNNINKTVILLPGEKLVAAKVESQGWMPCRLSFLIVDTK